jgi:hypothetical protein
MTRGRIKETPMTAVEEAQRKLDATRAQRVWAGRQKDFALEQSLARESYRCWVELELLKCEA